MSCSKQLEESPVLSPVPSPQALQALMPDRKAGIGQKRIGGIHARLMQAQTGACMWCGSWLPVLGDPGPQGLR